MGKLIVTEFTTLDGVAQAPGAPDEDREGGFKHGGWQAPLLDEKAGDAVFQAARTMGALLLGRRTYEIFAGYWPKAPAESPFTELLNRVPKYVASRTQSGPLEWEGSSTLNGDLAERVTALKAQHDEVQVIGSLDLVQSLLQLGLVDRMNVWLHPVVLGDGKRLFDHGTVPLALQLTDSETFATGVVRLSYEAAGVPTYGTVGEG
jgi:dihydrofolate reductase